MDKDNRFLLRLQQNEPMILAEGYLLEMEKRGCLQAGAFVPEVVLNEPDVLKQLHRDFVKCGSDIILAFTFYSNREKMRVIGKEEMLEKLYRNALKIAWEIQKEPGNENCIVAGNISNTTIYEPDNKESHEDCYKMFQEQAKWCLEEKAELIVGETFSYVGEALLALKAIKEVGLPCIINLTFFKKDSLLDSSIEEAYKALKNAGAEVVGTNCHKGPETIMPIVKKIRETVEGPIAVIPVPYRTNDKYHDWLKLPSLFNPGENNPGYPLELDCYLLSRLDLEKFAKECMEIGVKIIGVCCGNYPALTRCISEAVGKKTRLSEFSPDMSKSYVFGTKGKSEISKQNVWDALK